MSRLEFRGPGVTGYLDIDPGKFYEQDDRWYEAEQAQDLPDRTKVRDAARYIVSRRYIEENSDLAPLLGNEAFKVLVGFLVATCGAIPIFEDNPLEEEDYDVPLAAAVASLMGVKLTR